jgi:hypothetical protein
MFFNKDKLRFSCKLTLIAVANIAKHPAWQQTGGIFYEEKIFPADSSNPFLFEELNNSLPVRLTPPTCRFFFSISMFVLKSLKKSVFYREGDAAVAN